MFSYDFLLYEIFSICHKLFQIAFKCSQAMVSGIYSK